VSRRPIAAAASAVLLAGCATGGGSEREPPPATAKSEVEELPAEVERTRPGAVLQDFVRAAATGDEGRLWERLSRASRERLGPNLHRFGRSAVGRIEQELGALGRRHKLILSQSITPVFAVAAVVRGRAAYASALRLENGVWKIELEPPISISPLRPKPGEQVRRRTQLAAEVTAGGAIVEAGLWLDGIAFATRGGGPTPTALTMFGEASALSPGRHSVVAFASTDRSATARAWTFHVSG
jgi:hypothetical protein